MSGSALFRAMTAAVDTGYADTDRVVPAGVPVVMPVRAAALLEEAMREAELPAPRESSLGHYTRDYCGQSLRGRRLLAWRGAGIGDQIVFAGVLRYLAECCGAEVDLVCDPRVAAGLWRGAEGLPFRVLEEPLPLAEWEAYDYHWLACGLNDGDREPDQPDVWQGHLRAIGHGDAPSGVRRPVVPQSRAWTVRAQQFAENASGGRGSSLPPREATLPCPTRLTGRTPTGMGAPAAAAEYSRDAGAPDGDASTREGPATAGAADGAAMQARPARSAPSGGSRALGGSAGDTSPRPAEHPLLLWHLAASCGIRSYPPGPTARAIGLLARQMPGVRVVVTGAGDQYEEYAEACGQPNVVATTEGLCLQEVFALVGLVDCLVCPDSCLGHVAGAFGTPAVSLWCPFPARARVSTYPSHRPIEAKTRCSPCWQHDCYSADGVAMRGCPAAAASGEAVAESARWCRGLAAIPPEAIVGRVKEMVPWQSR